MGTVYGTLETQIIRNLGNRNDDDTRAMVMSSFNWFQNIVATAADWPDLMNNQQAALSTTTYKYHISTDLGLERFRKIETIKLYDGSSYSVPLVYVTPVKWDKEIAPYVEGTANGRPSAYTMRGNYVQLSSKPASGLYLDIWYFQYPVTITSTTEETSLPSVLDPIMVAATTALVWLGLEEPELHDRWMNVATRMLRTHNIDINYIVDHRSFSNAFETKVTPNYVSDPFVRRNP